MTAKTGDCASLSFKALMVTQFLGALNDNLYKLILVLIAVNATAGEGQGTGDLVLLNILFVLPFILFAPLAGAFSDRWSKTLILRTAKVMEVVVMGCALLCFRSENMTLLMLLLFFMGVHSALFSPAKYGILPEILDDKHLSRGNGYLEFWTFVAIIAGTALGGVVQSLAGSKMTIPGLVVFVISAVGLVSSFGISRTERANPGAPLRWNPLAVIGDLREIRAQRGIYLSLVGLTYFWSIGALFQLNIPLAAKQIAGFGDFGTALLLAALGLGIGAGSIVAGAVSSGKVEIGLVPVGAIGLCVFSIMLALSFAHYVFAFPGLVLLGFSGGFFSVPLNAYFQHESPVDRRGKYLAAMNFCIFSGMLVSSLLLRLLIDGLGCTPLHVFLLVGVLTLGVAVYICRLLPEMMLRCLNWVLIHCIYRLKVVGLENVPTSGGALLVCNHLSYVDPPLVAAAVERRVRFLMYKPIYEKRLIRPVAKAMGAIPVPHQQKPKEVVTALKEARRAIEAGELVAIFAEGSITRTGNMLPFQKGFEWIMKGVDAPIIPVHLDQVWGSIFSFWDKKFFWKMPREIPYAVTISFGAPLPAESSAFDVRQSVQELAVESVKYRRERYQCLHTGFISAARQKPLRLAAADSTGRKLSFIGLLAASLWLSRRLRQILNDEPLVGIMLPASVGAVMSNLAVLMCGRAPVNLNFTAAEQTMASSMAQSGVRTIITSRAFLERLQRQASPGMVFIEEEMCEFGFVSRFVHAVAGFFLPQFLLERIYFKKRPQRGDLATIVFSSGSTGEPKGVMLSHDNIASNIEAICDLFQIGRKDRVAGVLPFFHSFGFTGTLWLPLLSGIGAVYHANPLEAEAVGNLVDTHRLTVMMATPTFLLGYIRRCRPEQFKTLRYVVVGAEKLKDRIRQAFIDRFGVEPFEGYGCTELSPVAAINVCDYFVGDLRQIGRKAGTVGHPLPSVAARIVDPSDFSVLPPGQEGLLLIKGPNVMLGYLKRPEATAEVIRDGWYITGDIAALDEDGFISIRDRLSRFSKLGGEMVPHMRVEEEIHRALGEVESVCVVTSVADEKKGERLVVLSVKDIDGRELSRKLSAAGLPNLWIPKPEDYYRIDKLPVLGSGKLDLREVRRIASTKVA